MHRKKRLYTSAQQVPVVDFDPSFSLRLESKAKAYLLVSPLGKDLPQHHGLVELLVSSTTLPRGDVDAGKLVCE